MKVTLNTPLSKPINYYFKLIFDYGLTLCVFILLFSWLFPIIAIAIKLDSDGPIFILQSRVGKNGKVFDCITFRCLYHPVRATSASGKLIPIKKNDVRLTKIGILLRRTSLDKLPQFINVLIGDMAIIGPKSYTTEYIKEYSSIIESYRFRYIVKPGVFGWAQLRTNPLGIDEDLDELKNILEHDIWYIENWSFVRDIKILSESIYKLIKAQ